MPSKDCEEDVQLQDLSPISDPTKHDEESPLNTSLECSSDNLVSKEVREGGESSVASTSFNFINTIVGAGIIGIPFSIYQVCHLWAPVSHPTFLLVWIFRWNFTLGHFRLCY
jgi:hypothetical protein